MDVKGEITKYSYLQDDETWSHFRQNSNMTFMMNVNFAEIVNLPNNKKIPHFVMKIVYKEEFLVSFFLRIIV